MRCRNVLAWSASLLLLLAACSPDKRAAVPQGDADGGAPDDAAADLAPARDLTPADLAPDAGETVPDAHAPGDAQAAPDAAEADAGPPPDAGEADQGLPAPICGAGASWQAGTPIFREATADWRLAALGVQAIRLNVLDVNGDGRPDLLARKADGPEDFSAGGSRSKWLLVNTGRRGFKDVTRVSGALALRFPEAGAADQGRPVSVAAAADVDNDGDVDLFLGAPVQADGAPATTETSEILLNRGDGTFELGPADSALRRAGQVAVPAGASFVDVDRDGLLDLWVPQSIATGGVQPLQDLLYLGDGRGSFADATTDLGLTTLDWDFVADLNAGLCHSYAWSATACDLNGDGVPELLAASYGRAPNLLWQGAWAAGQVRYTNRSVASGYAYDDRMDWTDNESARCWCKLHRSDPGCANVPLPQRIACSTDADAFRWDHQYDREPFRLGGNSATTVCADVNNDGHLDLLTTEIVHWDVGSSSDPSELLVNSGEADVRFTRPGNEATGLTRTHQGAWNDGNMTAAVFDFDNDGWPDVYIGSSDYPGDRGLLYHQRPENPGTFSAVATADFFEHNRSHGVVVADFDGDGDLDVVVGHSFARCDATAPNNCYATQQVRLFENVVGNRNGWLQLRLEGGAGSNRSAIGARVTVAAGGVTQTQEVDGGHGHFGSQGDLQLHFGLGAACQADVTVRWPDAALTTTSYRLPAGHRFHLRQGDPPLLAD